MAPLAFPCRETRWEMVAHEGVDLGEEAGAERGGADEAEHGAAHDAVERAVHGGNVVAAEDVEHGLRVAGDEAAGLALQRVTANYLDLDSDGI